MDIAIRLMGASDLPAFHAHFKRHRAESGTGTDRFMPYATEDKPGPRGPDLKALLRSTDQPGWERWFCALDGDSVVGHVDLAGDRLLAGLHRCELGVGIERGYRGQGLGQRLLRTAIDFAKNSETLEWVDLRVFAHNRAAIRFYESLGFVKVAVQEDRFRIADEHIDDVMMKLSVA